MALNNKDKKCHCSHLQKLYTEIAKIITSALEISDVMDAIMNEVKNYFKPQNWSLLRLDPITQKLFFVICDGIDQKMVENIQLDIGEGIAGYVTKTKQSYIARNTEQDPYFTPLVDKVTGFKTLSVIAVPITFQHHVLGVIELINTLDEKEFNAEDLIVLETIADFSAIALTNATRYESMTSLASIDPLTGLYNRSRLNKLIALSANMTTDRYIVIYVDVNNMKYVNDSHGHRAGDALLVKTAKLLQSYCQENDLAFRIGGDEFLIILHQNDLTLLAERVSDINLQLSQHTNAIEEDQGFSFGIATGESKNLEQLITEADIQMYTKKQKNIK